MEHSNNPLTLDQLRGMVGFPYWHVGLQDDSQNPHWKILDPFVAKHAEDYGYGKRWLAYAYKPAHIDLESWKSEWERVCGFSECKNCGYDTKVESHFCPHCGKAMNQHALNIIKNRIGG